MRLGMVVGLWKREEYDGGGMVKTMGEGDGFGWISVINIGNLNNHTLTLTDN